MKTRELLERRTALVAEMRALTNAPAGTGGDLSAEQAQTFDRLKGDLDVLEKSIGRQQLLDEAERGMHGTQIAGTGDQSFDDACREFSLRKAIAGAAGLAVDWGREREIGAELVKRAGRPFEGIAVPMSVFQRKLEQRVVTGVSEGANIISTDLRGDQYIDALRAKMVTRRLGARVLSGLVGNVDIPKLDASASAAWVSDDAAITANDPDFNKISLTPKHAGMITEFSRSTLLQSSPDVEMLLRDDFSKVLANTLDRAAIHGSTMSPLAPDGVLDSGLDVSVAMGTTPTWAKVLELIEIVEVANAEGLGWITHPTIVRMLRSTAKVGSTDSVMIMESPNMLAGYPLVSTTNCDSPASSPPNGALIFGDWTQVLIAFWSELDILVNPYESTAYSKGNVQIRGMMTCDVGVRHAGAFSADVSLQS